jgi:multiple sugar transport system substrate-binding protein
MKTQMRKMISLLLAVVLMMGLIAGCGSSESGQQQPASKKEKDKASQNNGGKEEVIELRYSWWGSQDRHDRTLKVIELFQKENPNIKISPEFGGWDGYWDKLATQAAGKNLPDIIQMDKKYLAEYTGRKLIADLTPYTKSGSLDLNDVDEAYLSGGRVDGALYAVNIGANALAMAVDPAMYEKAGIPVPQAGHTWNDFMNNARQLKQNLGKDVYVRSHTGMSAFQYYLRGQGQTLFNDEGTALGYEDKYLVNFFTMIDTLLDEGVLPPPEVTANVQGLEDELIVHQKAPNHAFWSNQIVALTEGAGRPLDMIMIPIIEGEGDNQSYYIKPGQFMSVSTHSKHPEAAAKFIDFFTNSLEANEVLAGERGIPIAAKVRQHLYDKLGDAAKKMFDFMDVAMKYSGDVPPSPPGEGAVDKAFTRHLDVLSYGKATPEEAAKGFADEANEILAKNKK